MENGFEDAAWGALAQREREREAPRPEGEKAKVEGNHGAQRLASSTPHRDVFLSLSFSVSFALLLVCFYSYPKGVGIETRAHALNLHSVPL